MDETRIQTEGVELLRGAIAAIYDAVEDRRWDDPDATLEDLQAVLRPVFAAIFAKDLWD